MTWEDTTHNRIRIVYSIKWYFLLYVLSSHIYIYMLDKWSYRTCFYLLRKVSVRQSHHPTWYDCRMGSNHLIGWSTFIQWCEATLGFEMEREKKIKFEMALPRWMRASYPMRWWLSIRQSHYVGWYNRSTKIFLMFGCHFFR